MTFSPRPHIAPACLVLASVWPLVSCVPAFDFRVTQDAGIDGGIEARDALPPPSDARLDAGPDSGPASCSGWELHCLDAAASDVLDVPAEMSLLDAFSSAPRGSTIQIRAEHNRLNVRIPRGVTLRGCEGASIEGELGFAGESGTIEGFRIQGSVEADVAGEFVVRNNHFVLRSISLSSAVRLASRAGVAEDTALVVRANYFERVPSGVSARTTADLEGGRLVLTATDNLFVGVRSPLSADETDGSETVDAHFVHNTIVGFSTALQTRLPRGAVVFKANLLVDGYLGVSAAMEEWPAGHNHIFGVESYGGFDGARPVTELDADPFVDADAGDYSLRADSRAVDALTPSEFARDFNGCPRPVGELADSGAFERQ